MGISEWRKKTLYQRTKLSAIVYAHDPSTDDPHMAPSFAWLDQR
jgi:hypothetical protein